MHGTLTEVSESLSVTGDIIFMQVLHPGRLKCDGGAGRDAMDMGSLRAELQLPPHFITGESDIDLDEDIMMLGSTPQVRQLLAYAHWT